MSDEAAPVPRKHLWRVKCSSEIHPLGEERVEAHYVEHPPSGHLVFTVMKDGSQVVSALWPPGAWSYVELVGTLPIELS